MELGVNGGRGVNGGVNGREIGGVGSEGRVMRQLSNCG